MKKIVIDHLNLWHADTINGKSDFVVTIKKNKPLHDCNVEMQTLHKNSKNAR